MTLKEAFDFLQQRHRVVETESDTESKSWQALKSAVFAQQHLTGDKNEPEDITPCEHEWRAACTQAICRKCGEISDD